MTSSLQFATCDISDVHDFVVRNHYSGYLPSWSSYYFSSRLDGLLVGACVVGHSLGGSKPVLKSPFDGKEFNRELTRLAITDAMREAMPSPRGGSNSGTWFLGQCMDWLKKNTSLLGLISYADPEHDHDGGIYRVSGWDYTGTGRCPQGVMEPREAKRRGGLNQDGWDKKRGGIKSAEVRWGSREAKV